MLQPASDHPTVAARYRPAALNLAVGGDWYDVVDLDEHRRALVVGDCVGHGLEAATAMGQLRSATRALLLEGHDPATVLERLDVFATSIPGAYATSVVCAVVDRAGASVTYSRAGHVPPLLVGPAGARWLDDAAGALLQVVPDTSRPLARVDYIDGDLLLLYTDGLVERRGETIDVGLARLDAAARRRFDQHVHEIADGLLRDVLPTQRRDDVVLVAKRMVVDTTTPSAT
jgi:serine phosphatase RsbU (regulator of sigma subunit)